MTLIDLDQEVQFAYPDPDTGTWKSKTGTIKDILQLYTAYQFITLIDVNDFKWGNVEEQSKNIVKLLFK